MNKKNYLIALVIASGLCLASVTARAVPSVSLNVLDADITVGETFDVEVWVNGNNVGEELVAFGFDSLPDPALSSLAGYNGFTTVPGWAGASGPGTYVSDIAFPGIPDANVLLATLSFTANAAGSGTLAVQGFFNRVDYGLFTEGGSPPQPFGYDIEGSLDITIKPQAVPDSASFWMAAGAFVGLMALKQRFSRRMT